jgi:uncharacterized membrane protein
MIDKLKELNKNINAWWEKQQKKLTKGQHLILIAVCSLCVILSVVFTEEGAEKTILNYYLPFLCFVPICGSFCLNAIFYDKYKKK